MAKMTDIEALKTIQAWATLVPATKFPEFKQARSILGSFIKRLEIANNHPPTAWRMIHQALAGQGHVLAWSISTEDLRSVVRDCSGCNELPAGFSDEELIKEIKSELRRYGNPPDVTPGFFMWRLASKLARQAGLSWPEPSLESSTEP
jgi:hypothetical protein